MNNWYLVFGIACLLLAAAIVFVSHRKTRKVMNTLDAMLTAAMNGNFQEAVFDESMLSAVETRFAHYLSSSTVSAHNISQEKDRIKTLIADISHQTKTPIANLLLYTELLQEEPLSPQLKEYVAMLHSQTEKLHFLIDALVKLSRLENGILVLHPEHNDLWPLLTQIKEQFSAKATDKGLTFTVNFTEATACFDPKWTAEVLGNLVDNAIKYTSKGGVTISVIPNEMFTRIDIADTGIGISEENQAKIFTRFYRGDETAQQEGVGIGLSLAREILRKENGYIKVRSEVGKGSVFSVFLPS